MFALILNSYLSSYKSDKNRSATCPPSKMRLLCPILFLLSSLSLLGAAPSQDLVRTLPGLSFQPGFLHYSGYLKASGTHFLHYWFVLAEEKSESAPVLLWLNGGPGCSSMLGLLTELGPFRPTNWGQTLNQNPFSWNKVANVLFLESPAGVGYSYATDGNTTTDDDQTAKENYAALLYFFKVKFPEFRKNLFFISGESYGGVYLPMLASFLIKDKVNFPTFKGMAIGNGFLNRNLLYNSLIPFRYYHNLVSEDLWKNWSSICCSGKPTSCDISRFTDPHSVCSQMIAKATAFGGVNPYDLYDSCYLPSPFLLPPPLSFYFEKFLKFTGLRLEKPSAEELGKVKLPECAQIRNSTLVYLNRKDVRDAIHIPSDLKTWGMCSHVGYKMQYNDTSGSVLGAVAAGVRVLIYNGDTDSMCNAVSDQQFVAQLNRTILEDKKEWTYHKELPKVAGELTRYSGVDFLTVRGAGHMVPWKKPREALQMMANFIANRPYSSPVNISVLPAPPIGGFCKSQVLSPSFFGGPVTAESLCANGICVEDSGAAECACRTGYSGKFCNLYDWTEPHAYVRLCAVYETAETRRRLIPTGCPHLFHCVPLDSRCGASLSCSYPIGYCFPDQNSLLPDQLMQFIGANINE